MINFIKQYSAIIFCVCALYASSTIAAKELDDIKVIESLIVIFEEINFGKIEKNICYKTSNFLDPQAWRKMFPNQHYTLPEDSTLFQELVVYSKPLKVKYCDQDYMSIVESALKSEINDPRFYKKYMPSIKNISQGNGVQEDLILSIEAADIAIISFLSEKRKPILDQYDKKVKELHNRYWNGEG